jgi:hypothetical protein
MAVALKQIVPFGRLLWEYESMFALNQSDKQGNILGCGDGPASFNAQMSAQGYRVTSIDPIYCFSGVEIQQRFDQVAPDIIAQVRSTPDDWVWNHHHNPDELLSNRRAALEGFLADYEVGMRAGRYINAELPCLPFANQTFDLALCSHLLFLYSAQLDLAFHIASVQELCRVAHEVRIFPLLTLAGQPSPHIEPVRRALDEIGIKSNIVRVGYELQKGGNEMLVVTVSR